MTGQRRRTAPRRPIVQAALAAVHAFDRPVSPDVDDQADGHRVQVGPWDTGGNQDTGRTIVIMIIGQWGCLERTYPQASLP